MLHRPIEPKQYTSIRYTEHLEGIAASIGTVGDAFDNALMETVNGLFKTECLRTTAFHHGPFRTLSDVEYTTAGGVDWYNNRRLHGSLGSSRRCTTGPSRARATASPTSSCAKSRSLLPGVETGPADEL